MKSRVFYNDQWVLITASMLVALGLLMVASSSMVISDKLYGHSLHYVVRQSIYITMAVVLAWCARHIRVQTWMDRSGGLLVLGLILLVLVLIPGIGRTVNGSRRWLNLGVLTLQVSEYVKFAMILYMASFLTRHPREVRETWSGFVNPMMVLSLASLLLLMEPDFGAVSVIALTTLSLLFIAGLRLRFFFLLVVTMAGALSALAVSSPYRMARLSSFMHPWDHAFGSGYQLTQSLIAFGRGGFFGVGLGNSVQKLYYLPEAHTDFIFAVLTEELGLIGAIAFLLVFSVLMGRVFWIAKRALLVGHRYAAYVAYGFALWLSLQCFINIGVNIGLLPTKGLTLPFMSYGGTSLLMNGLLIGIVLRIADETHKVYSPNRARHA